MKEERCRYCGAVGRVDVEIRRGSRVERYMTSTQHRPRRGDRGCGQVVTPSQRQAIGRVGVWLRKLAGM